MKVLLFVDVCFCLTPVSRNAFSRRTRDCESLETSWRVVVVAGVVRPFGPIVRSVGLYAVDFSRIRSRVCGRNEEESSEEGDDRDDGRRSWR